MKIINAVWEESNLGKKVVEISISGGDTVDSIFEKAIEGYDYIVVKVEKPSHNIARNLTERGFYYIETMFSLLGTSIGLIAEPVYMNQGTRLRYEIVEDEKNIGAIMSKVRFHTDRISLDPHFGVETANKRYRNWVTSKVQSGNGEFAAISFNDEIIGFTFFIENKDYIDFALHGLMEDYLGKGLGKNILYIHQKLLDNKAITGITHVSSNNIPSLQMHLSGGYGITSSEAVFIRHKEV